MFGSIMLDWIVSNANFNFVVTIQSHEIFRIIAKLFQLYLQP
jgi:hypothetical protein